MQSNMMQYNAIQLEYKQLINDYNDNLIRLAELCYNITINLLANSAAFKLFTLSNFIIPLLVRPYVFLRSSLSEA